MKIKETSLINYLLLIVGVSLLIFALYKFVNGILYGFEFTARNLQLRGAEALTVNIVYLIVSTAIAYAGLAGIKNGK